MRLWMLMLLLAGSLPAQDFRASITGRVTDPSSAFVPRASVTVTNIETNLKTSTLTDERGAYTATLLPPGLYTITAAAPGFRQWVRERIQLNVGEAATVDISLQLGDSAEKVTVSAEVALLETSSASRGAVIDNKQVSVIPLNGRNPFILGTLATGVNYAGTFLNTRPFDDNYALLFSVNGSRNGSSEFLLDGAPNNAGAGINKIGLTPSVDAVAEFKVQTNSYDAQYGKTGGGIFNVSTKSGTNTFHGTVYEFARRNSWDANSFQNNAQGAPRGGHSLNQYGFVVTGPIYIPKVYDGRNKSFFMFNYEGYREFLPVVQNLSVPEPEMLTGDFSKLVDAQKRQITIYDPATGQDVGGNWVRQPFPGNIIPGGRINPIAKNVVSYMPTPNVTTPGVEYAQNNLFIPGNIGAEHENFFNIATKYDQNINANNRFFFRHGNSKRVYGGAYNGIFEQPGTQGWYPHIRWNTAEVLDWISTPSPSFIVNLRLSFTRYYQLDAAAPDDGFSITTLGFPQSVASLIPNADKPNFGLYNFDSYIGMGRTPAKVNTNTFAFHPNATKIQGGHTIKGGVDMRWIQFTNQTVGNNFLFQSGRQPTQRDYSLGDALSGNSIASWLLGDPTSGSITNTLFPTFLYKYFAPWVQDDWKVSKRLTLNLGLRWDFNVPANERYNRLNRGFDAGAVNSVDKLINRNLFPGTPTLRGALEFAGVNGDPRNAADTYMRAVQPRVGFAYRLTQQLVVRGGFGRYYINPTNDFLQSAGFSESTPLVPSLDGGRTALAGLLSNPYPNGVSVPKGAALGDQTYLGKSLDFVNTQFKTPHVNQFSVGFNYQVTAGSRVEASYVGSRTVDLQTSRPFNEMDLNFRKQCNVLEGGSPTFCNQLVPNPFQNLTPFLGTSLYASPTQSRADQARPYPEFGVMNELTRNDGKVWYNSLQTSYEVRARNLNTLISYTYSKMVEATAYKDVQQNILQRSVFAWDRPHHLTIANIYDLPFGAGRRWLTTSNAVVSRLVGGWAASINFTWQSGRPWDLPSNVLYVADAKVGNVDWSASKIVGVRPCVARMGNDGSITMQPFSVSAGCTSPNFIVTPQYAPRYTDYESSRIRLHTRPLADISFVKTTRITERTRAEFRAEAFNAFNTFELYNVQFDNNPNSTTFGTITKATASNSNSTAPRYVQLAVKFLW